MTVYRLTEDTAIRSIKPADKPVKHSDSGGLYLLQQPAGGKLWRMDYRHAGKRKTLALGAYPAVSLKDARVRRDEAKKLLANGQDLGEVKKAQKAVRAEQAANSFEAVARCEGRRTRRNGRLPVWRRIFFRGLARCLLLKSSQRTF